MVDNVLIHILLSSSSMVHKSSRLFSSLKRRSISILVVVAGLIMYRLLNSILLVPLPLYFSNRGFTFSVILGIHGIARFIPLLSLLSNVDSSKILPLLFFARGTLPLILVLPLGIHFAILLGLIYY